MSLGEKELASFPLFETDGTVLVRPPPSAGKWQWTIVWQNVVVLALLHLGAVYGAYLFVAKAMWATKIFTVILYVCTIFGITAGVHRYWTHRSFKAKLPLRLLLLFFNTLAFQDSVLAWVRNHRMHHKYADTDADPNNPSRGFFFAHIGWLLVRKHPDVLAKGHNIDISDVWAEKMLRFQKKYYVVLVLLACFILPTYVPTLWGESVWNAYFVSCIFRYVCGLNVTWLVNSAGHRWGTKPYEKNIQPTDIPPLNIFALGDGFHNYHHTFPWDYKTSELSLYPYNLTALFIDAMAKIGWAYDLKTVSPDLIEKRLKRTGDGSHEKWGGHRVPERNGFKVA